MEAEGGDDATLNASSDDADGAESIAIACRSEAGAFGSERILIFPDIAAGRSTRRVGERRREGREEDNEQERRRETRREENDNHDNKGVIPSRAKSPMVKRVKCPLLHCWIVVRIERASNPMRGLGKSPSIWRLSSESFRPPSAEGTSSCRMGEQRAPPPSSLARTTTHRSCRCSNASDGWERSHSLSTSLPPHIALSLSPSLPSLRRESLTLILSPPLC